MVVLDDDDVEQTTDTCSNQYDNIRKMSNIHIIEMEDTPSPTTFRKFSDSLLWLLVIVGIFMFFPVGFFALYFIYTARIFYHNEQTEKAKSHARTARMLSLVAVVLGTIWLGLLIGLSAWA